MYKRNPLLLSQGFVPAAEVGRALEKSLSTVHRLVKEEKCNGMRDGKALYIDLESMAKYFVSEGNPILAKSCRDLRAKVMSENPTPSKRAPAAKEA